MKALGCLDSLLRKELCTLCSSVQWNVNTATLSTFRTGGTVEALVDCHERAEVASLLRWFHVHRIPWRVIGGGSNILVTSRYHAGVFLRIRHSLPRLISSQVVGEVQSGRISMGAGGRMAALVSWCIQNGFGGLEFMAGIPGTLGGALRMNAGAFGHSLFERLAYIEYLTEQGVFHQVERATIQAEYRTTLFPEEPEQRVVILGGTFDVTLNESPQLRQRYREILKKRREKQPKVFGCAGSFFKNPVGDFAGRLIEEAGFKGRTIGKAMVSTKHANFIVNTGGALPEDIISLMQEIREKVLRRSGILLEPEVHII